MPFQGLELRGYRPTARRRPQALIDRLVTLTLVQGQALLITVPKPDVWCKLSTTASRRLQTCATEHGDEQVPRTLASEVARGLVPAERSIARLARRRLERVELPSSTFHTATKLAYPIAYGHPHQFALSLSKGRSMPSLVNKDVYCCSRILTVVTVRSAGFPYSRIRQKEHIDPSCHRNMMQRRCGSTAVRSRWRRPLTWWRVRGVRGRSPLRWAPTAWTTAPTCAW